MPAPPPWPFDSDTFPTALGGGIGGALGAAVGNEIGGRNGSPTAAIMITIIMVIATTVVMAAPVMVITGTINPAPKQLKYQRFSTHSKIKGGACPFFIFERFAAVGRGEYAVADSRY